MQNDGQYMGQIFILIIVVIIFYFLLYLIKRYCCKATPKLDSWDRSARATVNHSGNNVHPPQEMRTFSRDDQNSRVLSRSSNVLHGSLTTVVIHNEDLEADYLDLPPSYANSICSSTRSSRYNLQDANSESEHRIFPAVVNNDDHEHALPPSYEQATISIVVSGPDCAKNPDDNR